MLYQRSLDIEKRLADVLTLIRRGRFSTPMIAAELEVSIPTVSRDITALRQRGHAILARRRPDGSWGYSLNDSPAAASDRSTHEPNRQPVSAFRDAHDDSKAVTR